MAVELADARRVGVWSARRHMVDSIRLVADLPRVFDKLEEGVVSLASARMAAQEIHPLHPSALALADEVIAEEIDTVLPGQVRAMAGTRVIEIDPAAAMAAATQAGGTGSCPAVLIQSPRWARWPHISRGSRSPPAGPLWTDTPAASMPPATGGLSVRSWPTPSSNVSPGKPEPIRCR
ncbi:MAG: hypothetical protein ABJA81_06400 [Nocardioidaceae bacterium]